MKTIVPLPIDKELADLISQTAKETGLKKADVMRQGLRHGVPYVAERLRIVRPRSRRLPEYLDDYPPVTVPLAETEQALKEKLFRKHYGRSNR